MTTDAPVIWWVRRDLRLADNPALRTALARGGPVIPVFIRDAAVDGLGAAAKWRLGEGLDAFAARLAAAGSRLTLRAGDAPSVLRALIAETGAGAVVWNRLYDAEARARDACVKSALKSAGIAAESAGGHLLFEPWTVATGEGGFYRVYTPFWRAVRGREVPVPDAARARLPAPESWPAGARLADWRLGAAMNRGAAVVAPHACVGEAAAEDRLARFLAEGIDAYKTGRDMMAGAGTSRLSENLTYGEIGPRTVWHAGLRAMHEGAQGAEHFLKELVWREFAYHLLYHTPRIATHNWREAWDDFPWRGDTPDAQAWRQGRTGIQIVDAAMREMYVTGTMHNRGRMLVASFLTKHLMTHWKIGLDWFADCLIDWDPAANALGWQWSAGSGPDATPYFRVFNPDLQARKFDPDGVYRRRYLAEAFENPDPVALSYFDAIPRAWGLSSDMAYPAPIIGLKEGRERALAAYHEGRG
ncbi:deoxyribodipyrimidine photolyase [Rhodobacteraceae bacterium WD3A24]|nr:deoxyribodipyrimidine photolyase [Rhodobacteraceae bacterium WD3A24]